MKSNQRYGWTFLSILLVIFSACSSNTNSTESSDSTSQTESTKTIPKLKPTGEDPAWGTSIDDEMLVVMEKLQSLGGKPIESLFPEEARMQPTPTTAVMAVMSDHKISMTPSGVDTIGKNIPVSGGSIHARIYTPKTGAGSYPIIVYYHGGGWVIADLDTYDASARGLSEGTDAIVVSIHYRQGPEHKFPTAHNDAFAAYQWVVSNAASFKGDPKLIAVAGESAGGNLACNVSIMARDKGVQMPVHQVLIYPVASSNMNSDSYQKYASAKPLNKPMMEWFAKHYLTSMAQATYPRISLVNANLKGLPPTTIIGAEIDPLQTEGKILADKMESAEVDVNYKLYEGTTHEFFGMAAVVPDARSAQAHVCGDLKTAFKK